MSATKATKALTLHDMIDPEKSRLRRHQEVKALLRQARWLRKRGEYDTCLSLCATAGRLLREGSQR